MFRGTYMGLNGWDEVDPSTVTNLETVNESFSSWDTGCATTMRAMFRESILNPSTGRWNTSNVEIMKDMFQKNRFANPNTSIGMFER